MPPNDQALQDRLLALVADSGGRLQLEIRTVKELGADLHLPLGHSPNKVYDFTIKGEAGETFRSVAFTLVVGGAGRPSTRAEALGSSLAVAEGRLFDVNPFLLVFDYKASQFLAASAAMLFGAFAEYAESNVLPPSKSATFSLSPNFANRTLAMYASLGGSDLWHATLQDLSVDALITGLTRVRDETNARRAELPKIVAAIQARLSGAGSVPGAAVPAANDVPQPTEAVVSIPSAQEDDEVRIPDRVWRMLLTAVQTSPAVILVGPPGTGKTALLRQVVKAVSADPALVGATQPLPTPLWATPDESWTARELVGGDTVVDGDIRFRPGWVLRAIAENRWLVLDEANRADLDRIFGGLLTWLAGAPVSLGSASTQSGAPVIELGWNATPECQTSGVEGGELTGDAGTVRFTAGTSWRMLGTYNALDAQRVFRFGAALGRRFVRVPIPAAGPEAFGAILTERVPGLEATLAAKVAGLYAAHYDTPATRLGPALFLAMARYLKTAVLAGTLKMPSAGSAASAAESGSATEATDTATGEAPDQDAAATSEDRTHTQEGELLSELLSEAYVAHVGTWLAHLDERDEDELERRVVEKGLLPSSEWKWIMDMVQVLA